eukprot:TRINITY_DN879_c0_g1_i9.p1 TRINITY_DN879_c0_g1~~TRINITY_DN879_c0_g1_i9.p1  ORF type:complete len:116 (+),score=35.14 TRINITY_DN879_c0_g1_i9:93-440(+)
MLRSLVGSEMCIRDRCKAGPVFWVDSADSQPCMGTAGAIEWSLKCDGKIFHSGLPYQGINALEMVQDACSYLQGKFYEKFPAHPREADYAYACPSTMKPTPVSYTHLTLPTKRIV